MFKYLFLYAAGFTLSVLLTPLVRRAAIRLRALDFPSERKVHDRPVPRLGGVAVFIAFNAVILLAFSPYAPFQNLLPAIDRHWWTGFLAASSIIVVLGACDDVRPLGPAIKFLVQILAAWVAIRFGYVIDSVTLPWGPKLQFGYWSAPVTMLWIVGLTNAFNLIDGLDGLASGVAFFASLTLLGIGLLHEHVELALLCAVLAGTLLGFLRYNFHPASIFLGDSGSLFLGFTMAVLGIKTAHISSTAASMLVPLLAFGLPIMDTLFSMMRRLLRSAHVLDVARDGSYRLLFVGGRSMFRADRDHIHHRLMRLGINHRNAVVLLYLVCVGMGLVAWMIAACRNLNTGLVLAVIGAAVMFAIRKLRYDELRVLRSGALLPLSHLAILGYGPFQVVIDVGLIALAYFLAHFIRFDGMIQGLSRSHFVSTLPVVLVSKILVFHLSGLYRIKWQYASLPDVLRGLRSMVWGWIAAASVTAIWRPGGAQWALWVIDFYVTTSCLLGTRLSIRLLEYYAGRNPERKRKVLIYGADRYGSSLVHELMANDDYSLIPIGFVDDDLRTTRKTLHGYPIFGSCSAVPDIVRAHGVEELVVATPAVSPERLERIQHCCRTLHIGLRQFCLRVEEISDGRAPKGLVRPRKRHAAGGNGTGKRSAPSGKGRAACSKRANPSDYGAGQAACHTLCSCSEVQSAAGGLGHAMARSPCCGEQPCPRRAVREPQSVTA